MKEANYTCKDVPITYSDCGNGKPLPKGITRIRIYNDGACYDQNNSYIGRLQADHTIRGKGINIQMKLP